MAVTKKIPITVAAHGLGGTTSPTRLASQGYHHHYLGPHPTLNQEFPPRAVFLPGLMGLIATIHFGLSPFLLSLFLICALS